MFLLNGSFILDFVQQFFDISIDLTTWLVKRVLFYFLIQELLKFWIKFASKPIKHCIYTKAVLNLTDNSSEHRDTLEKLSKKTLFEIDYESGYVS